MFMSLNSTNHIKYGSTSKVAVTNKNFSFGVKGADDYGPSYITQFYNGVVPPSGGYTVYQYSGGQIYAEAAYSDSECVAILNGLGCPANNIADALTWVDGEGDIVVRDREYDLGDILGTFTLNLGDVSHWGQRYNGYTNITDTGFTCLGNTDTYNGVVYNLLGSLPSEISTIWTNAGLDINNAYAWRINFATGGDIIARVALNPDNIANTIAICPIDQTNTNWQYGNIGTPLLAGTFEFPATFTLYTPITAISNHTNWC